MTDNVAYLKDASGIQASATDVETFLAQNASSTLLRFSTAGSVDDGKSTLIGRLLHDSKNILEDQLKSLKKSSLSLADDQPFNLALLTDGLKAEREQGITIDVAYRYFSTAKRRFILADSPGHEQYTRNMATGASTADLTIILIDARKGVITQTKRHAFIASLLGVPRLLVAVNKMDLVDYSEKVFELIKSDFSEFVAKLGVKDVRFIPISALLGDNVVQSTRTQSVDPMPWYHGETVMEYLENVFVGGDTNFVDFRFPIQYVIRPHQNYRGYAGQIRSGTIRVGEEVLVLPSRRTSKVKSIDYMAASPEERQLESAYAPMSVAITLEDEIDISRGDMLVRTQNVPAVTHEFEAMLVWMGEKALDPSKPYILMHTTRESQVFIDSIKYKVDVNTLSRSGTSNLELNEIARVSFRSKRALFLDPYSRNRATGNLILIDPESFLTVGAGMVIDRLPLGEHHHPPSRDASGAIKVRATNLHEEGGLVSRSEREAAFGAKALTLWMTGLSGSGKSTIAKALEREMFDNNMPVFRLDGDNLRSGLNQDLGFSPEDRKENIRRAACVAKLMNDAGISVIASFISPFTADRLAAREIIGSENFVEVFVDTSIEVCETRDPHGLYEKARAGKISDFTGVSSPYEKPERPEVSLDAGSKSVEECVEALLNFIKDRQPD